MESLADEDEDDDEREGGTNRASAAATSIPLLRGRLNIEDGGEAGEGDGDTETLLSEKVGLRGNCPWDTMPLGSSV